MRLVCLVTVTFLSAAVFAAPTPLVSGNGFGFAVASPLNGDVLKLYTHPFRFEKPDPLDDLAEGIETGNFLKNLRWSSPSRFAAAHALNESHVLTTRSKAGDVYHYMPFGLARHAFVTTWVPRDRSDSSCLSAEWNAHTRVARDFSAHGFQARLLKVVDLKESLLLVPLDGTPAFAPSPCVGLARSWAMMSLENENDAEAALADLARWRAGLSPAALVRRELNDLEAWRVKPNVRFHSSDERKLWRQSEVVLRMAQSREPNRADRRNNGLIVASLPEGMWFVAWVRDMAYALQGLIRMGHFDESRAGLLAYFNAGPVGRMREQVRGFEYQISTVRYFGDGSEEPFFTMEGDVNVEYDNWGLVLSTLADHVEKFKDTDLLSVATSRGVLYDVAKDLIVLPLLGNLDEHGGGLIVAEDTSIWEEYVWAKKHFCYSTATAIHGLRGFSRLARLRGDLEFSKWLDGKIASLEIGFQAAFVRDGRLRGTLEPEFKNDIDGAVLEAVNFGVVKDPAVIRRTVNSMEALRMPSGGFRRVRGDTQYEKQEFLFINFSLAEIWLRRGRADKAAALVAPMIKKAMSDNGFVPEMYVSELNEQFPGEIGTPTGSIPMVGYGAGVAISYLVKRQELLRR